MAVVERKDKSAIETNRLQNIFFFILVQPTTQSYTVLIPPPSVLPNSHRQPTFQHKTSRK